MNLDDLIQELLNLKRQHGGEKEVYIGFGGNQDGIETIEEEKINFASLEYSGKIVIFGESIKK